VRRGWKGTFIGSVLGFFVGILPAAGATPASLMSYGVAKMVSSSPEGIRARQSRWRCGARGGEQLRLHGFDAADADPRHSRLAHDGDPAGRHGDLGPRARTACSSSRRTEFVWGLIGSFYISNVAAVLINLAFIPVFIWMLRMPFTILAPMIFVLSIAGGFAATRDMFDIWLIVIFGLGAFVLRRFDYPLAPAVLAIVLGPIAEPTLRQSLLLSSGDPSIFFTRPVAGPITVVAIILLLLPALKLLRRKRGGSGPEAP
jgi:putative tricarboxylic transport membrane protein